MTIQQQKDIADKILDKLRIISPYAILAGGAPRDWYFGKEARDFDFYFYSPADTQNAVHGQFRKALDVDVQFKQFNDQMLYTHMGCIRRILECEIDGIKCQFMQLNEPKQEFKVVDKMSCSICKAWYLGRDVELHKDFKLSVATKTVFLSDGYNWSDPHPKKIQGYLPELGLSCGRDRQQVIELLVNRTLKDFV